MKPSPRRISTVVGTAIALQAANADEENVPEIPTTIVITRNAFDIRIHPLGNRPYSTFSLEQCIDRTFEA